MLGKKKQRNDFNDKMNPKNKYYKNPPKFEELANKYPSFKKFVIKTKFNTYSIDWKDKEAGKELCRCLLKHDFNLKYWDIPDGFLIPSITSRCNYIHWIHDILEEDDLLDIKITGLDIGTGANCIYPLLGHQIYGWNFKCAELNKEAVDIASNTIQENNLNNHINIVHQEDEDNIFYKVIENKELFVFSMCNPPYFSYDEIKHDNPNTVYSIYILL